MPQTVNSQRFSFTTDLIDIRKLERESRKFLYLGFVISIAFHAAVFSFIAFKRPEIIERKLIKSIPVDLVVRPTRRTTPFGVRKKGFRKKILSRKYYPPGRIDTDMMPQTQTPGYETLDVTGTVDSLDIGFEPDTFPGTYMGIEDERFIPEDFDIEDDGITRIPDRHISLTDEMIEVGDLDTGQYKALLIYDPNDRLNIKGYVHIPVEVWSTFLRPGLPGTAMINLREAFYRYTGIIMKLDKTIHIHSQDIFKYPFVYICPEGWFDFFTWEAQHFRKYLDQGGFVLIEPDDPPAAVAMHEMIKKTFGDDIMFKVLPDDHTVYHSVFDMPPLTAEDPLEGIWQENRLVLIYSEKAYGEGWIHLEPPSLKMGVNIVVYALESSSITQQMIDYSTKPAQNSRQWWDIETRKEYE